MLALAVLEVDALDLVDVSHDHAFAALGVGAAGEGGVFDAADIADVDVPQPGLVGDGAGLLKDASRRGRQVRELVSRVEPRDPA